MLPFTLTITARGSLLIGGGDVPDGLHGAHIHVRSQDDLERPILPASALRGALRETLEALLRGAGRPACDAGTGREPGIADADAHAPSTTCALDQNGPCTACRLFGGSREKLAPNTLDFSLAVLGDGALDEGGKPTSMLRPGVAVGRRQRSAEENRLFVRRTTATGAVFIAKGWLRDGSMRNEFKAAVEATKHIGAGRSRGTARVDIVPTFAPEPKHEPKALGPGDVVIRVKLLSPTILGVPLAGTNLRDTRREIPGAALRGAIGFALAGAANKPDFASLVDEDKGARFGFLSPVNIDTKATSAPSEKLPLTSVPSGRLPLTSHYCKSAEAKHRLHDDLLDRIAVALTTDVRRVEAVRLGLRCSKCSVCKGPLRAAKGFRRFVGDVRMRVATRVSLERRSTSARTGALFTEVYLEPDTVFEGSLRNIPPTARDALALGLALPLSIGRARGAGRGQVSVEVVQAAPRTSITARGDGFEKALSEHLKRCHLPSDDAASLVAFTFLSPAVITMNDGDDEWNALKASLPERLRVEEPLVRVRRFVREGSWDQRTGTMHAWRAIAAGAVYVIKLPTGTRWRDVVGDIETFEQSGVGERRHQGYGDVYAFDPIHFGEPERQKEDDVMSDTEATRRKKLVVAAESVMSEFARRRPDKAWGVEKSQLNQLIGVCGEALCAEEIENYLRYQASRERPSWGLDLVKLTIAEMGKALEGAPDDREKVEAWRHYAVFLARAYTYQAKAGTKPAEPSQPTKAAGGGDHRGRAR